MTDRRHFLRTSALGVAAILVAPAARAKTSVPLIKERGVLRIGVAEAEPLFHRDPATGLWSGICATIAMLMAEEMEVAFETVETRWEDCAGALAQDRFDLMPGIEPTPERRRVMDFPRSPLFYQALGVLARPGVVAARWSDLDRPGQRIGVVAGTPAEAMLTPRLSRAVIVPLTSQAAEAALGTGDIAALADLHPALVARRGRIGVGDVVLPHPIDPIRVSVGLRSSGDPLLRDWVNTFIQGMYGDGQLNRVFDAYVAGHGLDPRRVPGLVREAWS